MPIVDHTAFSPPPDCSQLWRYVDLTKFVSLLATGRLFFARADKLGDQWEGSTPKINLQMRKHLYPALSPEQLTSLADQQSLARYHARKHTYVSCWHNSDHESAAMWKLYSCDGSGIALCTFPQKLRAALAHSNYTIYLGEIRYINYETDPIHEDNLFWPFLCKRASFAHEKEVRAIIHQCDGPLDTTPPLADCGIAVDTDLSVLIEQVFVAPGSPTWVHDLIESLVRRFGLSCPVVQSSLDKDPVY